MIRAKLKEKFGKTETEQQGGAGGSGAHEEPSPDSIPDETSEEVQQEEEDEATSIKCITLIRNMMIERGLEGSFSLTMYRILFTRSWNIEVAEGDAMVTNSSHMFQDTFTQRTMRAIMEKATNRLIANLIRKGKRWGDVPYSGSTTVAVAISIPFGFFSFYLEISSSVSSLLAYQEKLKTEGRK